MSQFPPPLPPSEPPNPYAHPTPPPLAPSTIPGPLSGGFQSHRGGLVLGLGITSLALPVLGFIGAALFPPCGCSWVVSVGCAIAAWIMANSDLRLMAARTMDPAGMGSTNAGKICAIISIALHCVLLVIFVILFLFVGLAIFGAAAAGAAGAGRGTP